MGAAKRGATKDQQASVRHPTSLNLPSHVSRPDRVRVQPHSSRAPAPERAVPRPRLRWRWFRRLIIAGIWGALAAAALLLWFARDLPRPESALDACAAPA